MHEPGFLLWNLIDNKKLSVGFDNYIEKTKDIIMSFFNQVTENHLNVLLNNASKFKLIILWGEKGNGKTFIAQSVLKKNHIKTKDIIFSEENLTFFE